MASGKGLDDRAYCVAGLQEAVSELILPSTTGNLSLPDSICFKRTSQAIRGRRVEGKAGTWNPWHYLPFCPGHRSLPLVGGYAEPLRGWRQGSLAPGRASEARTGPGFSERTTVDSCLPVHNHLQDYF